ncbi:TIGR04211 family SH3 domain-containing protein [Kangiella sediminilitoris]|uniref:SH3 type 3 domain protein n=1 Tax=Kangiella sediminilitoris TaxID=1144748 RepID=A0A1B3B8R1_9GAMM|nr:TIGR04211 family SH3 domain-containing protein [Kangiella sediminilitoris]AOE49161.1 SH3 type 3 domain protein [Kangiella sediminilitoris]
MFRILTIWAILFTSGLFSSAVFAADEASTPSPDSESQYYVSDDLGVILRSGPTNRYRVIGKITAGTPITILQSDTANESSEVRVANGDSGWIRSEYITVQPTVQAKYQQLITENQQLKQKVAELTQEIADKGNVIQLNDKLQQEVSQLENEAATLRQQAALQKDRFHKDVFYAGAIVLLFGMFLSWILSRFSQKKRHRSGWR